jgi:CRP-like cAMP-binding protein
MTLEQSNIRNWLLRGLSPEDFQRIAAHLEPIDLPRGFSLADKDEPATHCYFPERGIGSVVAVSREGAKAETGLVGREGLVPHNALLGAVSTPYEIFMQAPGYGHRIKHDDFLMVLSDSRSIEKHFLRFVQTMSIQAAYTALSNAIHHIDERLARWILMCHDRTEGDEIELTHEFLAIMLAVRRPSVTTALHVLEGNRLIVSERGLVTVRDRQRLESFANDAYGTPERDYHSAFGEMK